MPEEKLAEFGQIPLLLDERSAKRKWGDRKRVIPRVRLQPTDQRNPPREL